MLNGEESKVKPLFRTDEVFQRLMPDLKGKLVENRPMSALTTWRIGGPARYFAVADSLNELRQLLMAASSVKLPYLIIGRGSNLLVSDNGFNGLVIRLGREFQRISVDGEIVQAGAAVPLPTLVQVAVKHSLKGLAFAVGIPGSFGGALVTNAGAHGSAIGDVTTRVTVYTPDFELSSLDQSVIRFGYRKSNLNSFGLVVEGVLKLSTGDTDSIRVEMERYFRQRKRTQPLNLPSAGSIFKNPKDLSAGRLIEEAGLKGFRIGDAQVSPVHANFIVNLGQAKAMDVYSLIRRVQQEVFKHSQVKLEPEITLVGKFD